MNNSYLNQSIQFLCLGWYIASFLCLTNKNVFNFNLSDIMSLHRKRAPAVLSLIIETNSNSILYSQEISGN